MRKHLPRVLAIGLLSAFALPQLCLACSCAQPTFIEASEQADVVFRGRVTAFVQQPADKYRSNGTTERVTIERAVFRVDTVWKGQARPEMSVFTRELNGPYSGCEYQFRQGRDYLVYAYTGGYTREFPVWLSTSSCSGTREARGAVEHLTVLGPGTAVFDAVVAGDAVGAGMPLAALDLASVLAGDDGEKVRPTAPDGAWTTFVEFGFRPAAVALDGQGNVYVSDIGEYSRIENRVLRFSPTGQLLAQWGGATGFGPNQFADPYSLAADGNGNVYVADRRDYLRRLAPSAPAFAQWGPNEDASDQIGYVNGLATDGQGNLYVSDGSYHYILKLSATGVLLARWGAQGSGPGEFRRPAGVVVDGAGHIYVADAGNHRVQKLSPMGEPLAQWGVKGTGPGEFKEPAGVAVDGAGNIYVTERGNNRVQQLSPSGRPVAQWGTMGSGPGRFRGPWGIAVDSQDNVYVADGGNYRIQRLAAARR